MSDDTQHPDFIAACTDAHVLPEHIFGLRRSEERSTARRAITCRLLHAGWRPGRVAKLIGVNLHQVQAWAKRCPARFRVDAWRPPPEARTMPGLARKLRRMMAA